MAKRGLAYTWLDVRIPQVICKGCGNEFEYIEADCTYKANQLAKGLGKGSSKGKGHSKGDTGKNNKGQYQPKGYGKRPGNFVDSYYIGDNGKGKGKPSPDLNQQLLEWLNNIGAGISPEQSTKIKCAMEIRGVPMHKGPISPPKKLTELQTLKLQQKQLMATLSMASNTLKQAKDKFQKLCYECHDQRYSTYSDTLQAG